MGENPIAPATIDVPNWFRALGFPAPPGSDTELPSQPGTPLLSPVSSSQIDVSWGASTDNVAVDYYRLEVCQGQGCSNFAEIQQIPHPTVTYSHQGLTASTWYRYRVFAVDTSLNESPSSGEVESQTLSAPTASGFTGGSFSGGTFK